ncbi:MAG TPA: hypothetical protein VFB58_02460 [Chloroflexota bacterium]|nr:hypothetical protein [Chloroflexota bacterium]
MNVVRDAVLWVWDFVVGDLVLAIGVAITIVVGILIHHAAWAQIVFVLLVLATLTAAVYRVALSQ